MKKELVAMKCYVLGDAIGAMCETTRVRESADDSITEEELKQRTEYRMNYFIVKFATK